MIGFFGFAKNSTTIGWSWSSRLPVSRKIYTRDLNWFIFSKFCSIFFLAIAWCIIPMEVKIENGWFTFHSWNLFVAICAIPRLLFHIFNKWSNVKEKLNLILEYLKFATWLLALFLSRESKISDRMWWNRRSIGNFTYNVSWEYWQWKNWLSGMH